METRYKISLWDACGIVVGSLWDLKCIVFRLLESGDFPTEIPQVTHKQEWLIYAVLSTNPQLCPL